MKKLVLCLAVTAAFSSITSASEVFEGARVGLGYTHMEVEDENMGNGFKAELAYDFNKILGTNISYEQSSDRIENIDVDTQIIKLGADLGYAFPLQKAFLKPYIKIGYQFYDMQLLNLDIVEDDDLYYGLGLRFQYQHFYADLSFDKSEIKSDLSGLTNISADATQTALTVGYKF